jgi:glycosyltransferase involved in cell wall biosynthesis
MLGACLTTFNEADIIEASVRNLLEQGVERILIADQSTDGTRDILRDLPVGVCDVEGEFHEQERWMNALARLLGEGGCDWIIPADADEFWFGPDGKTVAEFLAGLPTDVNIVNAELWHHRDWDYRYVPAERLPKVAFRWHPDAVLANGNHSVTLPAPFVSRGLEIRHYQFRGLEHFCSKVRSRSERLLPASRARGDGSHITRMDGWSDKELAAEWSRLTSQEVELCPIPFSR